MQFIYSFGIFLYWIGIHVYSAFNKKANQWIAGRKTMWENLKNNEFKQKSIWIHCASLGEFEQAKPVIDQIKDQYPLEVIVLTFFSPSGYDVKKNYHKADYVFYLPIDLPGRMNTFIQKINPKLVIFVKYEFWFNCLHLLQKKQVNYIFISALFRKTQFFFMPFFNWYKKKLQGSSMIFVQDQVSLKLLDSKGFKNIIRTGDTRVDSVIQLKLKPVELPLIDKFKAGQKLWICGSIHPSDYAIIQPVLKHWNQNHKLILAPHEMEDAFINKLKSDFASAVLFSKAELDSSINEYSCLIIDTVGLLKYMYAYADLVYVGGGFGKGIHNILEPAIFEKPILFGPHFKKFKEAVDLVETKGAICIKNTNDLQAQIQLYHTDNETFVSNKSVQQYFAKNKGNSQKIMDWIRDSNILSPRPDNSINS